MEHSYLSSLLSSYAESAQAIYTSNQAKNDNTNSLYRKVGIKFVINTAGKLYPVKGVTQINYRVGAEGYGKQPVMCQSTFLKITS